MCPDRGQHTLWNGFKFGFIYQAYEGTGDLSFVHYHRRFKLCRSSAEATRRAIGLSKKSIVFRGSRNLQVHITHAPHPFSIIGQITFKFIAIWLQPHLQSEINYCSNVWYLWAKFGMCVHHGNIFFVVLLWIDFYSIYCNINFFTICSVLATHCVGNNIHMRTKCKLLD